MDKFFYNWILKILKNPKEYQKKLINFFNKLIKNIKKILNFVNAGNCEILFNWKARTIVTYFEDSALELNPIEYDKFPRLVSLMT